MAKKEMDTVGADEPIEVAPEEVVNMPTSREYADANEKFYQQLRENEQRDDLAIRIMNLANDTHTHDLKALAAKHLAKRFS